MNLIDFPREILAEIIRYLDPRSFSRLFCAHATFRSFYDDEVFWRQRCHDSNLTHFLDTYRDTYCKNIPLFDYVYAQGPVTYITLNQKHYYENSIVLDIALMEYIHRPTMCAVGQ
jgi:hypothetical protein